MATEEEKVEQAGPLTPLTDEELTTLARDIVTNRVFITGDAEKARMCFLVIGLVDPNTLPSNLGAVWEYVEKAGPMAINGLPMFFSAHFIAIEDIEPLRVKIEGMEQALGLSQTQPGGEPCG